MFRQRAFKTPPFAEPPPVDDPAIADSDGGEQIGVVPYFWRRAGRLFGVPAFLYLHVDLSRAGFLPGENSSQDTELDRVHEAVKLRSQFKELEAFTGRPVGDDRFASVRGVTTAAVGRKHFKSGATNCA